MGVVLCVAPARTERGVGFLHSLGSGSDFASPRNYTRPKNRSYVGQIGERIGTADEGRDANSNPCEVALAIREPRPTSCGMSIL